MADVHDKATRSFNMSRIKNKDTKPEMLVRSFLHRNGFRYTLHSKNLPGKPDIFLKRYNAAIFVNGCFWHGHKGCRYFVLPKTRAEWWKSKIEKNVQNDIGKKRTLQQQKIKVITIWECELKRDAERALRTLIKKLRK